MHHLFLSPSKLQSIGYEITKRSNDCGPVRLCSIGGQLYSKAFREELQQNLGGKILVSDLPTIMGLIRSIVIY